MSGPIASLSQALPRTAAAIDADMGSLHVGAQLFVSLRGNVIADAALGLASPDTPMSTAMLMPWMSCSKVPTSVAFVVVWECGLVALDAPVCR